MKKSSPSPKVQQVAVQMFRHMGTEQISAMLEIDPKLTKKACAQWLVENAYNQTGTSGLTDEELKHLDKILLKEAKIVASSAL